MTPIAAPPHPESLLLLGLMAGGLIVLSLLGWLHWRLRWHAHLRREAATEALIWREAMTASPDAFYVWSPELGEVCSRRLAVLLDLEQGTEATFDDVLIALEDADAKALDRAVTLLRSNGDGFRLEATLKSGLRRLLAVGQGISDPAATVSGAVVWLRDITDQAQEILHLHGRYQEARTQIERLRTLMDGLSMPVWLRGQDLSLLEVNRAYARAVDADSPAAVINGQIELAPDTMVREARALASLARAAGEMRSGDFHLVLAGERYYVMLDEYPVSIGDERFTVGTVRDLTATEEVYADLQRHIAAHAEVLERLSTPIAIFATDTRLTFFNTAFAQLWRLDTEWASSHPTYGAVLELLRERRLLPEMVDWKTYRDEELQRFTTLIDPILTLMHLPDGRTLRRLISAHPYGGLIYTFEDVTDSLAMERSFNTAVAVQKETLDHLHEGIAVFGADERMKLFNPAFVTLWNLQSGTIQGEPHLNEVLEWFKPQFIDDPEHTQPWEQAHALLLRMVKERQPLGGVLELRNGRILQCTSVPLPDGATLLTWLDQTDSTRVERALLDKNQALSVANAMKNQFIANVATEVNRPLSAILDAADTLTDGHVGRLGPAQIQYARTILLAGQRLQSMITDTLDLALLDAGQMVIELDTVEIQPMVAAVSGLMQEQIQAKDLTLDIHCPDDVGWIAADGRRLKQIVFHLLGNAVRYTQPGGRITVSLSRRNDRLSLTVADNGPGIEENCQATIFDSFVRSGDNAGTGLGLALVRRFVELHGGRVELSSRVGLGTSVTVHIPTGDAKNQGEESDQPPSPIEH